MHWYNAVAVKDRCNFSMLADGIPRINASSYDVEAFLPDESDCKVLIGNISTIVGRVLVQHIPGFSEFSSLTVPHIEHPHSKEMSTRSHIVSLLL